MDAYSISFYSAVLISIAVMITGVIKAKLNKQKKWFWILFANLILFSFLAVGAGMLVPIIYMLWFQKKVNQTNQSHA